jgi:hypothetical protein
MVGFGDDLSSLAPSRLSYWTSLDEALHEVTRRTDAQVQACGRRDADPVAAVRMSHPDTLLWGAEIIFVAAPPSPEETERLDQLAADPKRGVAAVVVGDVMNSPWRFVVDEKNQAVCRLLGLEVDAHSIKPGPVRDLVALFDVAETEVQGGAGHAGVRVLFQCPRRRRLRSTCSARSRWMRPDVRGDRQAPRPPRAP